MRVAVLADIHGNLQACEAVLEDIARESPDAIVAAGDVSLRGAYPAETLDLVRDRCTSVLMGNTDAYLAGMYLHGVYRDSNHWKTGLLHWTRAQLGQTRLDALSQLAFSVRFSPRAGRDLYICHANPRNLEDSIDPTLDDAAVRRLLLDLNAEAVAFGHLHFPYRRRLGRMLLADVASAGIPRDGDVRPAWGLFDYTPRGWRVQLRRVRYPVKSATQALFERGVPGAAMLAQNVQHARYRHHQQLQTAARKHMGLPPRAAGRTPTGPEAPRPPRPPREPT